MDTDAFVRDGFLAVRGAVDAETARACRDMIWDSLGEHGVNRNPATWTRPSVQIGCPEGEPFAAAGTSPALSAAYDELIGPTRLVLGSHLFIPAILQRYGETGVPSEDVAGRWRPSVLCRGTAHATGRAGDVYLCHPFIVHTATWPHRGTTPRMIAQPAVHAGEGFALDGSDSSPVARAIVTGLTHHADSPRPS